MSQETNLLLRHNYIPIPKDRRTSTRVHSEDASHIATVLMNLSYYGFSLNASALKTLCTYNPAELESWWLKIEPELRNVTGDDREIVDFVVYKNFPKEVLDKSEAEYWFAQICMYWGLPNELFTQDVKPRDGMDEQPALTVLQRQARNTLDKILDSYVRSSARWKDQEKKDVLFLATDRPVDFSNFSFKENMVALASHFIKKDIPIRVNTGTDVLRLAAGMNDGDVSLRENVKFKVKNRRERRFYLCSLEKCANLEEDLARRPEVWKRFLYCLHPFDYKTRYPKVCAAADKLYNGNVKTFNSVVEGLLANKDEAVLKSLSGRPGEFRRRLVHCLDLFEEKAAEAFSGSAVLNNLSVAQLVSTRRFLDTANSRKSRIFPPKGNWNKLQIREARQVKCADQVISAIDANLSSRVPKVKMLDLAVEGVKLPSNDGEVSPYARGTVFPIPDNVKFIRTASYWQAKMRGYGNVWFDNGWNFFNEHWLPMGACCWTEVKPKGAAFSGDPTNSKEMKGRAAQLIDLYLGKLEERGVRYAVWNILCYSHIPFSEADEVYAALQWGEKPQKGKLFEPSRCQLSFPLTGNQLTKYVCYIDLKLRELVYMDANLPGQVRTATANSGKLAETMPAFVEYLNSLPSVYDLFRNSVDEENGRGYVVYSEKDVELKHVPAYVFRPENESNLYEEIDINAILQK